MVTGCRALQSSRLHISMKKDQTLLVSVQKQSKKPVTANLSRLGLEKQQAYIKFTSVLLADHQGAQNQAPSHHFLSSSQPV